MADTGFHWGAWAFATKAAGGDWDASALADNATTGSPALISLDGKAGCEVGIALAEDNTGAIDGDVTVYVLGDTGIDEEEATLNTPWSFTIRPIQNDVFYKRFNVDPGSYGSFEIAVKNESGQELAVSVKIRTATIPVAS